MVISQRIRRRTTLLLLALTLGACRDPSTEELTGKFGVAETANPALIQCDGNTVTPTPEPAEGECVNPVLSAVEPASARPGETVTLKGKRFGYQQGVSKVTFNGVEAVPHFEGLQAVPGGDVLRWSENEIVVRVPERAANEPGVPAAVVVSCGRVEMRELRKARVPIFQFQDSNSLPFEVRRPGSDLDMGFWVFRMGTFGNEHAFSDDPVSPCNLQSGRCKFQPLRACDKNDLDLGSYGLSSSQCAGLGIPWGGQSYNAGRATGIDLNGDGIPELPGGVLDNPEAFGLLPERNRDLETGNFPETLLLYGEDVELSDSSGFVGLRRVRDMEGQIRYGITCAFCHSNDDLGNLPAMLPDVSPRIASTGQDQILAAVQASTATPAPGGGPAGGGEPAQSPMPPDSASTGTGGPDATTGTGKKHVEAGPDVLGPDPNNPMPEGEGFSSQTALQRLKLNVQRFMRTLEPAPQGHPNPAIHSSQAPPQEGQDPNNPAPPGAPMADRSGLRLNPPPVRQNAPGPGSSGTNVGYTTRPVASTINSPLPGSGPNGTYGSTGYGPGGNGPVGNGPVGNGPVGKGPVGASAGTPGGGAASAGYGSSNQGAGSYGASGYGSSGYGSSGTPSGAPAPGEVPTAPRLSLNPTGGSGSPGVGAPGGLGASSAGGSSLNHNNANTQANGGPTLKRGNDALPPPLGTNARQDTRGYAFGKREPGPVEAGLSNRQLNVGLLLANSRLVAILDEIDPLPGNMTRRKLLIDQENGRFDFLGFPRVPSDAGFESVVIPHHLGTTGFTRLLYSDRVDVSPLSEIQRRITAQAHFDSRNVGALLNARAYTGLIERGAESVDAVRVLSIYLNALNNPDRVRRLLNLYNDQNGQDQALVQRGRDLFQCHGCARCHSPSLGRYTSQAVIPAKFIGTDPRHALARGNMLEFEGDFIPYAVSEGTLEALPAGKRYILQVNRVIQPRLDRDKRDDFKPLLVQFEAVSKAAFATLVVGDGTPDGLSVHERMESIRVPVFWSGARFTVRGPSLVLEVAGQAVELGDFELRGVLHPDGSTWGAPLQQNRASSLTGTIRRSSHPELLPGSRLELYISGVREDLFGGLRQPASLETVGYRVPKLIGLKFKVGYFHDGSLKKLEDLMDPERLKGGWKPTGFAGHPPGYAGAPGHEFTLLDSPEERKALLAFLQSL